MEREKEGRERGKEGREGRREVGIKGKGKKEKFILPFYLFYLFTARKDQLDQNV